MLAWLILATLAWGALAAFTASQHASGAGTVVASSEPLAYDAQQIWTALSDANDAAAGGILGGGVEPTSVVTRYEDDLRTAKQDIVDAAARGGPMADLDPLQTGLTAYEEEVAKAVANNRLGYPVGAAYLRQASDTMISQLLPTAHDLYTREDAQLTTASAQATGLPLIAVTVLAGIALGFAYYRCGRWLTRRTNRVLNGGLLLASAAGLVALLWMAGAFLAGRADLLTAQSQGSTPVIALASTDIAVLKAHADESLTLINNSGDDSNQAQFLAQQKLLGPGPGTLLSQAQSAAAGSPAAADATAAVSDAPLWFSAHVKVRSTDDNGQHQAAVGMAQVTGPAGKAFAKLSSDLNGGIVAANDAFVTHARSGQDAFTGLEAGEIVATLIMVAGIAWGLSRRLAEYR
jgi:hypothetical protein